MDIKGLFNILCYRNYSEINVYSMQVDPKRTLPFAKKQVASVVGEPVSDFKGFFNATQTIFKSLRKEVFFRSICEWKFG